MELFLNPGESKSESSRVFEDIYKNPILRDKFNHMSAFRFDVELTVHTSRAFGVYGEAWLVWYPLDEVVFFQRFIEGGSERLRKAYYSQLHHIVIDFSKDSIYKLYIPWTYPYPMATVFDTLSFGKLVLHAFEGIRVINAEMVNGINVRVTGTIKNMQLGGPTSVVQAQHFPREKISDRLFKVSETMAGLSSMFSSMPRFAVPSNGIYGCRCSRFSSSIVWLFTP
jgi:hypothetical protein